MLIRGRGGMLFKQKRGPGSQSPRRALRSRSSSAPGVGYGENLAARLRRRPSGSLPFTERGGLQPLPGSRRLSVRTSGRGGSPGWVASGLATRALSPETVASAEAGGLRPSRGARWATVFPRSPAHRDDTSFRAIFQRGRRPCLTSLGSGRPPRSAGQSSPCRARRGPAPRSMLGAAACNERSPRELAHSVSARRRQAGASVTDVYVGDAWERQDVGFRECAVGASAATPRPLSGGGDAEMGAAAAEADRTLFVGNLETKVTEELLFELFHQVSGWDRPFPLVFRWRRAGPHGSPLLPCPLGRPDEHPTAGPGGPEVALGVGGCRTLASSRGREDQRWWEDPR